MITLITETTNDFSVHKTHSPRLKTNIYCDIKRILDPRLPVLVLYILFQVLKRLPKSHNN